MPISRGGSRDITFIDPVTLIFDFLTSDKMGDHDLSCTVHLPHTYTHKYRDTKRHTHADIQLRRHE